VVLSGRQNKKAHRPEGGWAKTGAPDLVDRGRAGAGTHRGATPDRGPFKRMIQGDDCDVHGSNIRYNG
jgi:hypothetical protein